jgi:hypothetical protein
MLFNGIYLNVTFYNDGVTWRPKRCRVHKVWKRNRNQLSKEEWIDLLAIDDVYPSCIERWYEQNAVVEFA